VKATGALGICVVVLAGPIVGACGAAEPSVQAPTAGPVAPSTGPVVFADDGALKRFRSNRFRVSIPLPDGRTWKIDDHTRPELVARHAPTSSSLTLYSSIEPDLVNRQKCEERARALGLVPPGELRTVEDQATVGPDAYDTRIWVALSAGRAAGAPLVGHVFAFGAYIHKCLFFHFASEVASDRFEDALSSRLATARLRIFGGLALEAFDEPPRDKVGRQ
jgi:hypothetical protein